MDDSEIATKDDLNATNSILGDLKEQVNALSQKLDSMSEKLDSMKDKFDQLDSLYVKNNSSSIQDAMRSMGSSTLGDMIFNTPQITAQFSVLQSQISALASKVGG